MLVAAPQGLQLSFRSPRCYSPSRIPPRSSAAAEIPIPEEDFAFDYREELERTSLSAEELFHGGKIRSLLQNEGKSSKSEAPRCSISHLNTPNYFPEKTGLDRGRVRPSSPAGNRVSRSLSPVRVSAYHWETTDNGEDKKERISPNGSNSRRWKLMDLLLFRSSSEGRAARTEHALTKCSVLLKKNGDGIKNLGFGSMEANGEAVHRRSKSGQVSTHDLHYTVSRAAAGDLKKRTFLPYKKGILFFNGY